MAVTWNAIFEWDRESWREEAACRSSDATLFFPVGTTGLAVDQIQAAKDVCRTCAAQHACLLFAFETNQEAGIWGGKDEEERRRLRRVWRTGRQVRAKSVSG
ncbi:MAG: WhiB family transcriptional regulator, redox-sensing transcriptional regulator [Actinomycetota bacterium]|jgi:WhiB family redox-sensing transcriptional regulator|nr:WhiB family transcriptional regulator, redox-sensing transcriptional regulator [Actinomycetota bacterium]